MVRMTTGPGSWTAPCRQAGSQRIARERHALVQTVRRHAELALPLDVAALAQPRAAKDFAQVLQGLARG